MGRKGGGGNLGVIQGWRRGHCVSLVESRYVKDIVVEKCPFGINER